MSDGWSRQKNTKYAVRSTHYALELWLQSGESGKSVAPGRKLVYNLDVASILGPPFLMREETNARVSVSHQSC